MRKTTLIVIALSIHILATCAAEESFTQIEISSSLKAKINRLDRLFKYVEKDPIFKCGSSDVLAEITNAIAQARANNERAADKTIKAAIVAQGAKTNITPAISCGRSSIPKSIHIRTVLLEILDNKENSLHILETRTLPSETKNCTIL